IGILILRGMDLRVMCIDFYRKIRQVGILSFILLSTFSQLKAQSVERNLLTNAADLSTLSQHLIADQDWVPYPSYDDRAGWNHLVGDSRDSLLVQGERMLDFEWNVIPLSSYLEFERSGSRTIMQAPLTENYLAMRALVLAELAEGEGRFIDKIIDGTWLACEMTSWVLSAHLGVHQANGRPMPDPNEFTIDLGAGRWGAFYSWVYYFFKDAFDEVSPLISARLKDNIEARILAPFMARDDFWWQAFDPDVSRVNNWNPWCNFNVLMCFLLVEEDDARLAKAVYRTMVSTDKFINYVNEDGACEEGPSYWGHAAGKLFDYLDALALATNGHINLFDEPMIKDMGEYIANSYVGDGWMVNFADATARAHPYPGLIYRYGLAVDSDLLKSFAGYAAAQGPFFDAIVSTDLSRILANFSIAPALHKAPKLLPERRSIWYPQTEFCYLISDEEVFLAAKGGYNNESHNHNDAGTFSLYMDSKPIFIDVGVGTYTRQTFSRERYSIWTMQSDYHNLPIIDDKSQKFGNVYKARQANFDPENRKFTLDISGAYDTSAVINSWVRSYALSSDSSVEIIDEYKDRKQPVPSQINFMTWTKPQLLEEGKLLIEVEGAKALFEFEHQHLEVSIEKIPQTDERLRRVWGEQVYRTTLTEKHPRQEGSYRYRVQKHS
nr:heparinase II/III-family protein [Saprospiraceae bacterium]